MGYSWRRPEKIPSTAAASKPPSQPASGAHTAPRRTTPAASRFNFTPCCWSAGEEARAELKNPESEKDVWWGTVNIPFDEHTFQINRQRALDYLNTRPRACLWGTVRSSCRGRRRERHCPR